MCSHTDASSKQSKLFYDLINTNTNFSEKIFTELIRYLKKKKYLDSYLNHIGEHILPFDYSEFYAIKNKKEHCLAIVTCAILWAFNETSQYKYTAINDLLPGDSHSMINEAVEFIDMFKAWNVSYNKELILNSITKRDHNSNMYRIFSILEHNKIIKPETIYIIKLKRKKKYYFADNFIKMKIVKIHTESLNYRATEYADFLFGDHYSACWKLCIPNNNNNSFFNLKKKDVLSIMSKAFTNIDFEHYKSIKFLYLKEHDIKEFEIYSVYEKYLKEYKLAVKQNNRDLIPLIGKKLSIYQKAIELKEISNMHFNPEEKFFLPWNYDFRGRTYYLSDISFTFNKEFRWCMYQGYYANITELKPEWHPYNSKIQKILNEHINLLDNLTVKIKSVDSNLQHAILWLLISLGEVNKSKLGVEITITQFVNEGIKIYNNANNILETFNYEEKIKILTLTKTINELSDAFITEQKIKKRLISKDAPASVFQHLVLSFGWKNEETLKMVNLKSEDTWYDIYSILISNWKNSKLTLNEGEEKIMKLFNRKSLKKIIMTSNYGVGYNSAENYFKDVIFDLNPDDETEFRIFVDNNWVQVKNFLEDFFNFISNLMILENNPNKIIEYIASCDGLLFLTDAIVDLNYYKKRNYIIDILDEGKRYTKSFYALSEDKDNNKFKIAARANYVHSLDAALTRWVIRKYGIFTIHDCFLIDPANITYLISLINEGMGCKFDTYRSYQQKSIEIFSIFVVI